MRCKIAIIGYTDHRRQAPFENPEWEKWGLNDLYLDLPVVADRSQWQWFQCHQFQGPAPHLVPESPTDFRQGPPHPRDANHLPWLQKFSQEIPIWVVQPHPDLPDCRTIPRDDLYAYFDDGHGSPIKYFTNSISWMMGMAIMRLAPVENGQRALPGAEMGVFGVDMMVAGGPGSEYGYQRPSCEFFLGWARGAGIRLTIPHESDLLKSAWQYGELEGDAFRTNVQAKRNAYSKQRGEIHNQLRMGELHHAEVSGYINACDQILHNLAPGDPAFADGRPANWGVGTVPEPDGHKKDSKG